MDLQQVHVLISLQTRQLLQNLCLLSPLSPFMLMFTTSVPVLMKEKKPPDLMNTSVVSKGFIYFWQTLSLQIT